MIRLERRVHSGIEAGFIGVYNTVEGHMAEV